MLNNLQSFIDIIKPKAYVIIRQRLNYVNRQFIKKHNGNPQTMLNVIDVYYKPTSSELYIELVRQLHSINISPEGNVRQYEKDFHKVNVEIINLNDSLSLPESYLIQFFLIRLDKAYDVFMIIYT